ncbi:hypothetical protein HDU82_000778 [Entophlyctis luteolus]|nr:hypothetical protein HDU82_000778 [Entophlyctis luteolus]
MAKKGKDKKKDKKSKKGKKKASSHGHADAVSPEQASALLTFLTQVSFGLRIPNIRDLMKLHRQRLDQLGKSEYFTIKRMSTAEKEMDSTIVQMTAPTKFPDLADTSNGADQSDENFTQMDKTYHDDMQILNSQRNNIIALSLAIETLKDKIDAQCMMIQELQEFEATGGADVQESIAAALKAESRAKVQQRVLQLEKIQNRHDASVIAMNKRKERILLKLEANANQANRLSIITRNKSLVAKVSVLQTEYHRLRQLVRELENQNMYLLHSIHNFDWNLMYGKRADWVVVPFDEDDGGTPSIEKERSKPLSAPSPMRRDFYQLKITSTAAAIDQVKQRHKEMEIADLFSLGVIGTQWHRRHKTPSTSGGTYSTQKSLVSSPSKLEAPDPVTNEGMVGSFAALKIS